jgi:hypothetical protein
MKEISKPENKTYYFIKNPEGSILQEGWVYPHQVLSTPDSNTIYYSDKKIDIISDMESELGAQTAFNDLLTFNEEREEYSWGEGNFEETFFIFADQSVAEPLSRALYSVVNPAQEGLYARVYNHPDGDSEYSIMEFRKSDIIPIALGADATPLAEALAITVEDGVLTQQEVDNIVAAISAYAGQEINLVDFIPASWADKQIDKETAIDLGYILE